MAIERMSLRLRLKILVLAVLLVYPLLAACTIPFLGAPVVTSTTLIYTGLCGRGPDRGDPCTDENGEAPCAGPYCSTQTCVGGANDGDACWDLSDCSGGTCLPPSASFPDGPTFQNQLQEGTLEIDSDGDGNPDLVGGGPFTDSETPPSYTEPALIATLTNFVGSTVSFSANSHISFGEPVSVRATCTHRHDSELTPGYSKCIGTSQTRLTNFSVGEEASFLVLASQHSIGPGAADTFLAQVDVTCDPIPAPTPHPNVDLTGLPFVFDIDDDAMVPGECIVTGNILDSRTGQQGSTQHILTITIMLTGPQCRSHDECGDMKCSFGSCGPGDAGEFCVNQSHCNQNTAPHCVSSACRVGFVGDSCRVDRQCVGVSTCNPLTGLCE